MSANLMSLARSGGKFLKLFGDRKMMKQLPGMMGGKFGKKGRFNLPF